ncbi:pyridoxamine 5'-phosphate oxidase family protein [Chloroflexota bacterium]
MAKITQDIKDIAAKARPCIMATATRDGKPNGVPIAFFKIISDDEIILADVHMQKTRQNIDENPMVAVAFWSTEVHYGYQLKGKARVETSGKILDETVRWLEEKGRHPKAVVVVKVDEIYYIGGSKDSTKRLD